MPSTEEPVGCPLKKRKAGEGLEAAEAWEALLRNSQNRLHPTPFASTIPTLWPYTSLSHAWVMSPPEGVPCPPWHPNGPWRCLPGHPRPATHSSLPTWSPCPVQSFGPPTRLRPWKLCTQGSYLSLGVLPGGGAPPALQSRLLCPGTAERCMDKPSRPFITGTQRQPPPPTVASRCQPPKQPPPKTNQALKKKLIQNKHSFIIEVNKKGLILKFWMPFTKQTGREKGAKESPTKQTKVRIWIFFFCKTFCVFFF